jgi:CelD/BcsL family acetyltransferase involved in cellulose biosynthesis
LGLTRSGYRPAEGRSFFKLFMPHSTTVAEFKAEDFLRLCRDDGLESELRALVLRAVEENVFYEEWMLLPALRGMRGEADIRLICVRNPEGRLVAVFPMELTRHTKIRAVRVLRLWRHDYCFLCTPLVDKQYVMESSDALGRWIESGRSSAAILEFHSYTLDSRFGQLFLPALTRRSGWVSDSGSSERALLIRRADPTVGISPKHRKELRRVERRLAEIGRPHYTVMRADENAEDWIERFLSLEAAGWKGQAATALGSIEAHRSFFYSVTLEAHRRGRLHLMALELDGAPIAMKCNFVAIPGSFAFKIAYDEKYHKYSPGLLLELFNMEYVLANCPEIEWMDSCADPGHKMIERLWAGRRRIGWRMASGRGLLSRAIVSSAPGYRRLKQILSQRRSPRSDGVLD